MLGGWKLWDVQVGSRRKFGSEPSGWWKSRSGSMIQSGRPGLTPAARERVKELERENRELKRSNEILRKASACFAQAELARRGKSSWRVSISIGTRTGSSRSAGRGRSPRPPTTPTRRVWPTRAGEVPGPSVTTPAVAGCRRRGTGTSRSTASASCGGSSGAKALHTAVAQTFGAAAALQVGQQPLTHGRVLGGAIPHAQGVFLAGDIDTQRDDDAVGPPVHAVEQEHGEVELGERGGPPGVEVRLRLGHEPPTHRTPARAPGADVRTQRLQASAILARRHAHEHLLDAAPVQRVVPGERPERG